MYAIISGGVLLALCDKPRYVKKNEASGAYVEAAEAEAIGISVSGDLYNLGGGTAIPDAPEAIITRRDIAEYVFQNRVRIAENEAATNAANVEVENALCDLDTAAEGRMAAMEDTLCELDSSINGGGEN